MSRLTRRQAVAAGSVALIVGLAVVAGLADQLGLADLPGLGLAAVAVAVGLLFTGLLQLRRRVAQLSQQLGQQSAAWAREAQAQRRAGEQERAQQRQEAAQRQQALVRIGEQSKQATQTAIRQLGNQLVKRQRDQTQEFEALLQLFRGLTPRAPMPSSGHWALNPTDLLELWSVVDRWRPALALELGSGTSSVWLGYALERHGGRLVSLEHDPGYAAQSRAMLERHGLTGHCEVRDAPLREVAVAGETFRWYEEAALSGLAGVDLLVVDGPPGGTGPQARYPALPLLAEKLSPHAAVLLDDADRSDEQQILDRWMASQPGLSREPATIGHLAVLRFARQPVVS